MTDPCAIAIGGYFELEEAAGGTGEWYPDAHRFQSARAALLALATRHRPRRIWLPVYLCGELAAPLAAAGIELGRYRLDQDLGIVRDFRLQADDWLVCVNYFGVADARVAAALAAFPAEQVVLDQAQAFFSPPRPALATLYSPRKFFGVPDGGYLLTGLDMAAPRDQDADSEARAAPMRLRRQLGAEAGHAAYRAVEAGLAGLPPRAMSEFTRGLLAGIDYVAARARRQENFRRLHAALCGRNTLRLDVGIDAAPLCYPFVAEGNAARRARLRDRRVYCPTYWPGLETAGDPGAARLAADLLALPIDQRYGEREMETILELIDA